MTASSNMMATAEFLAQLQEMLQTDAALTEDTALKEMEEWDSLAFMVLIAFFDKHFGKRVTFDDLKNCTTPADLITLAAGAIA